MTKITPIALLAALAACGGNSAYNPSTDAYAENAPTYDKLAISQNDADDNEPAANALNDQTSGIQEDVTGNAVACHPHLFVRTHEIIGRLNRHFVKQLHHIEDLIADDPITAGTTKTWENVKGGIDRKLTMTKNADGSFSFELDLGKAATSGSPTFVTVATGSVSRTVSGTATETKGTATFDYSALATVETNEKASGQVIDSFDIVKDSSKPGAGVKRSATISFTNFTPEEGDPHGPRNGSYTWEREPGTGGFFSFQDTVVLLCPSNPSSLAANTQTVARWYKATDGSVHGRTDATATGGQIPSGDKWEGVTCASGQTTSEPAEGYWMMKEEDANGATVQSQADQSGATPCDSAFGAVPAASDNSSDYDFSAAVSFPNEW